MSFFRNVFGGKPQIERLDVTKRFDLLARVGQGSMSQVWRARDTRTGQLVCVKVLDKQKTDRFEARFEGLNKPTEGEVAILLDHPHVVKTYEYGYTLQDEQFLVMEFLEGTGLSFLVDMQNSVMQNDRVRLVVELGEAVSYIHANDFIHRDICPRNVMLDQDNHIKLIDFGLMVPNTPDFQKPGNRTGTANYMAPELIRRGRTDQRLDIFAFAVTVFEMYTQQMPWGNPRGQESLDSVTKRINYPPRPIREVVPDIDADLAHAIDKGLAMAPEDRWETIDEMLEIFRDELDDDGFEDVDAQVLVDDDEDDEFEDVDAQVIDDDDDEFEDVDEMVEVSERNEGGTDVLSDADLPADAGADDDDDYEDVTHLFEGK